MASNELLLNEVKKRSATLTKPQQHELNLLKASNELLLNEVKKGSSADALLIAHSLRINSALIDPS